MLKIKPQLTLIFLICVGISSCSLKQSTEVRNDFKKYYEHYKLEGSFVLYDQQKDKCIFYNQQQFKQSFSPASTFKICNTLIGLETGVIKDENFVILWDSVVRQNPNWNGDHDLKNAFKNFTVWYYQELARRVGGEKMKYWIDKANYGNKDTSGDIDKFWLKGGLRITPEQQIDFLNRLHDNQLPFSQRSIDILKKIMIVKDTLNYVLRAKTGWAGNDKEDFGWYVGYLEKENNTYYFSNCVRSKDLNNKDFAKARIEITDSILKE